uniref:Uncharacterized protein n=1 Tax=Solanum lycopersicum TaxID=4081 RepID=A0A3Q7FA20_SOLLC
MFSVLRFSSPGCAPNFLWLSYVQGPSISSQYICKHTHYALVCNVVREDVVLLLRLKCTTRMKITGFDAIVSADALKSLKPAPDIFLAASRILDIPNSEVDSRMCNAVLLPPITIFFFLDTFMWVSMLGQKMLGFQLTSLGAFDAEETVMLTRNLDQSFKLFEKFFDIYVKVSMLDRYQASLS